MKVSALQKYILVNSFGSKKVNRKKFDKFYDKKKNLLKGEARIKIITKSIERLINKGLIVGYGEKTQHKWYISEVELTHKGKLVTRKLLGEQIKLPLKKK